MNEKSLKHYGVLGMRWGVRKGKGTPTAKPSGSDGGEKKIKGKTSTKKEDVKKLTDKQLRDKLNRMNMEQQYSSLTRPKKGTVRKMLEEVAVDVAKKQMKAIANDLASSGIKKSSSKLEKAFEKKLK